MVVIVGKKYGNVKGNNSLKKKKKLSMVHDTITARWDWASFFRVLFKVAFAIIILNFCASKQSVVELL